MNYILILIYFLDFGKNHKNSEEAFENGCDKMRQGSCQPM